MIHLRQHLAENNLWFFDYNLSNLLTLKYPVLYGPWRTNMRDSDHRISIPTIRFIITKKIAESEL